MTGLHFAFWFSFATLLSVENRIFLSCAMLDPPCLMPFVLLRSSSLPSAKGKADVAWPGLKSPFSSSGHLVYCLGGSSYPKIPHCRGGSTCTAAFIPQCHHGMCLWKGTPAQICAFYPSFHRRLCPAHWPIQILFGGWNKNLLSLLWFRYLPWRIKRKMLAGEQGEKERDSLHPSERTDDIREHWEKLEVESVRQEWGEKEAGKHKDAKGGEEVSHTFLPAQNL